MKTEDFLKKHDACSHGAKWALSVSPDMAEVWDALVEHKKHEWLWWTVTRPGVFSDSTLRRLACRFVRETPLADGRKVWDLLTDQRSRRAVEVAEAYAAGNATTGELAAAYVAAASVARDAACAADAAVDADWAADRAACVADCAAAAVADAAARAADAAACAARAAARAADRAACVAARAAAFAAYADAVADAADCAADCAADRAARAAACAADAAYAAQVQMIAGLGNPFRKKEPSTAKRWSKHYIARVLRFAEKNDGDWNEECPTEEEGLEVPVYGDADLIIAAPAMHELLKDILDELRRATRDAIETGNREGSSLPAKLERRIYEGIKEVEK